MNIQITGRHIEITEPIKQHVEKQVSKFSKLVGGLCDFNFVLTVEKHRHIAEVTLNTKLGTFTATEESKDLYTSIGTVVEKLEKQVRKIKDKRQDQNRTADKEEISERLSGPVLEIGTIAAMAENPGIVEMTLSAKPMSVDEAIHELKESAGQFVVFHNAKDNAINVLYRRQDGNYGLIHA